MQPKENSMGGSEGFSVNDDCIGCVICAEIAPNNFRFDHEQGCGYVGKQPNTKKEVCLCIEAKDICPVSAIEVADEP